MTLEIRRARLVSPPVDEERLARQLVGVERRMRAKVRQRRLLARAGIAGLSLSMVFVIAFFALRKGPHVDGALAATTVPTAAPAPTPPLLLSGGANPGEGATVEMGPEGGTPLRLADGTSIELAPETRVTFAEMRADRTVVSVEQGTIELDVTHVEGRVFLVRAGRYDVRVVGTHFRVEHHGDVVEVSVARGTVQLEPIGGGESRRLEAGESWSVGRVLPPTTTSATAASAGADETAGRAPESAKHLLARAQAARAAGRTREAAEALDALRLRHRDDPRAGLAAFELGRLRLDVMHDPRGAVDAFTDAIAIAPAAPFREDAEARRVEAYDVIQDGVACRRARAAYLDRYPNGVDRAGVLGRCGGR